MFEGLDAFELAFDAHHLLLRGGTQGAGRQILIDFANRTDDFIDADLVGQHLLRLEIDGDLTMYGTTQIDLADTGYALHAFDNLLIGKYRQLAQTTRAGQNPKGRCRLRAVELPAHYQRVLGIAREARSNLRHFVAHILNRFGHVGGELELGPQFGATFK